MKKQLDMSKYINMYHNVTQYALQMKKTTCHDEKSRVTTCHLIQSAQTTMGMHQTTMGLLDNNHIFDGHLPSEYMKITFSAFIISAQNVGHHGCSNKLKRCRHIRIIQYKRFVHGF